MVYRKIEIMCTEIGDLIMEDMNLIQTVDLMVSENYKERFIAEYLQLKIRRDKLAEMIEKYENGTLDFEPKTPLKILDLQLEYMNGYLDVLEKRANLEDINIGFENPFDHLPDELKKEIDK